MTSCDVLCKTGCFKYSYSTSKLVFPLFFFFYCTSAIQLNLFGMHLCKCSTVSFQKMLEAQHYLKVLKDSLNTPRFPMWSCYLGRMPRYIRKAVSSTGWLKFKSWVFTYWGMTGEFKIFYSTMCNQLGQKFFCICQKTICKECTCMWTCKLDVLTGISNVYWQKSL